MNRLIVITLVLLSATISPAQAQNESDYVKVLDFRDEIRSPELHRKAMNEADLEQLFNELYPSGEESLVSEMQAVWGSFSKPGNSQILVTFISTSSGGQAGWHGNVVLLEGNQVLSWANDGHTEIIEGIADFDQDGLQEAVTSYTDGGQGYFHTEVATLTFKGGTIAILDRSNTLNGTVEKMDCSSDDGFVFTSGFYFLGSDLVQRNYSRRCSEDTYEFYSEGIIIPNDWDHDGISDDDGG